MPDSPQMTYEQIEEHLKKANLSQYEQGGQAHIASASSAQPTAVLGNVCNVYNGIKPILNAILAIPLIPPFIKNAIRTFMNVMNGLCP